MPLFRRSGQLGMSLAEAEMLDFDLLIGGYPRPWLTDEENELLLREAWTLRREALLRRMPAGRRPGCWWYFEAQEAQPYTTVEETARLRELGELSDAEEQEILRRER